jgi:protein Tex
VVRVKVLGVDVGRKRISLTLRLDDEPGDRGRDARPPQASPKPAPARPGSPGSDEPRAGRRGGPKARGHDRGAQAGDGAMAEALRRAGLIGGDQH